jgi:hypothetical protein
MDQPIRGIAIRLADEGVPVQAIARATQIPSGELLPLLSDAIHAGQLIAMPASDWPPNDAHHSHTRARDRDQQGVRLQTILGATRAEARLLLTLIHAGDLPTQHLPPSNPVPVQIHRLRRHLAPHGVEIRSVWGCSF